MLLSDRDLRSELADGRLGIDPLDPSLIQPSSIDVRLDNMFRVFNNSRYTHIDPAQQQDELTELVEVADGDPFVLHPASSSSAPRSSGWSCPMTWRGGWRASPRSGGWGC